MPLIEPLRGLWRLVNLAAKRIHSCGRHQSGQAL
jgi:hypothetical protein